MCPHGLPYTVGSFCRGECDFLLHLQMVGQKECIKRQPALLFALGK